MESDLRAMLHVEAEIGRLREWVHDRFRKFGAIDDVRMPRGRSNWDSGMAWVRSNAMRMRNKRLRRSTAQRVLHGCNMFIDFAVERKLVDLRPIETVDKEGQSNSASRKRFICMPSLGPFACPV